MSVMPSKRYIYLEGYACFSQTADAFDRILERTFKLTQLIMRFAGRTIEAYRNSLDADLLDTLGFGLVDKRSVGRKCKQQIFAARI